MKGEKLKRRKVMLSTSILPYFIGISDDLMFFIAINSLFFTVVKGLSTAEFSFLTTISSLSYILLQIPFLKIIQKIGNIKAIRLGTWMLLISSILMTFGNNYAIIMIGNIIYTTAFLFKKMDNVVLENNLRYLNKQENYAKILSKSKLIYSIITTIIALIAGGIFAINHYLPMYLCIGVCVINIFLSFCIFDANENKQLTCQNKKLEKIRFSRLIQIIIISFGICYATISIGQTNSKLLIQYNLQEHFNVELTATYLGLIIVTSRISRILGNLIFRKIYSKLKDKINVVLPIMGMIAFACIILGNYIDFAILTKFALMTIGFDLILLIRDSIEVYATDLLLKNTKEAEQQKAVSYLQLSKRIVETAISLLFSLLLIKLDLIYAIICLFAFAIVSLGINSKLYKMLKCGDFGTGTNSPYGTGL